MMDALLCQSCKRVEEKPWKVDGVLSPYNSCSYCGSCSINVSWLRTKEQKKEALIAELEEFYESAKRVMELASIAFPERRAMQQHEDGTVTEAKVSRDVLGIEDLLQSLLAELKTLTRKVGE
jgi:hypothetical protein